jgi:hypothetical protein
VQAAVGVDHRHPIERADWPHRVEVAKKQNRRYVGSGFSRTYMELRAQVIAAFTLRERCHRAADRAEARRQLGTAAIDRRLVVGRRLDPYQ